MTRFLPLTAKSTLCLNYEQKYPRALIISGHALYDNSQLTILKFEGTIDECSNSTPVKLSSLENWMAAYALCVRFFLKAWWKLCG